MADPALQPADSQQAERLHTFAHDLKNRLGGLWEAIRLLRTAPSGGPEPDELMAFAERGYFQAQRDLEELLDDFAVERGITAERSPFDLGKSTAEALVNEDYRLRKKGQRVVTHGLEDLSALGDARLTTQIMRSLVSNASKFSPHGAEITLEAKRVDTHCEVRVIDKGCGLSTEDLVLIFSRYIILSSRGTNGEPQARGTLARARQWAQAQGGTLVAMSPGVGQGCVFTLRLPIL